MTADEARALIEQTQRTVVKTNQPVTRYPHDKDCTTNTADRPLDPTAENSK